MRSMESPTWHKRGTKQPKTQDDVSCYTRHISFAFSETISFVTSHTADTIVSHFHGVLHTDWRQASDIIELSTSNSLCIETRQS